MKQVTKNKILLVALLIFSVIGGVFYQTTSVQAAPSPCPYNSTHNLSSKYAGWVTYQNKNYLSTYYECVHCGTGIFCDGRPAWVTGAYMGNYAFPGDCEGTYVVEGTFKIKANRMYYSSSMPLQGWIFH